jgi:MATE family multidrug resistance protein
MRYLPWAVSLPIISVAGFQLDGVFIGATRVRELRDSMLVSFLVFLGLAIGLERFFGNNGLWFAFCGFMAMRGVMFRTASAADRARPQVGRSWFVRILRSG